ncbi:N-acetyltransferase [Tumebacillus flagellatus]|uniref:N-acetyltransferase n=1 Tax=Tumebacillus flagellatus TaxID=1157490 RepID=UPI000571D16C|nr:N-acetyltransferase [Tumebacillus flagellatus]
MPQVQSLQINYQTLEEFKKFRENGLEELSMLEDLRANMIEDNAVSPFYGIYEDGKLVARISLYKIGAKYNHYTETPTDFHELMKLEVLPGYKGKGYGTALVEFAKTLGLPIKTNVRLGAQDFFLKRGFQPVKYDPIRDRGENPYIWLPE